MWKTWLEHGAKEVGNPPPRGRHNRKSLRGQHIQRDPLGRGPTPNLHEYARSNPVNWLDPLGLETCEEWRDRHLAKVAEYSKTSKANLLQALTDAKLTVRNALAEIMADEFNLIGEGLLEVGGAIGASVAVGVADAVAPAVSRAVGQAAGQAVGGLAQRLPQVAAARGAVGGGVRSALAKVPTSSMGRNLAFALVQFFLIKDRAGQTGDKAMNFITQWDEAINQVAANERETIDDYAEYYTGIVKAAYGVCKGNGEGCYMRMGHMPELSFTARTYSAESILTCAGGEERARLVLDDDRSWKQRVAEAMRKREGK